MPSTRGRHIDIEYEANYAQNTSGDVVAKHQSKEEWDHPSVGVPTRKFEDEILGQPTDHNRKPEID
jgi:hypothetical protein